MANTFERLSRDPQRAEGHDRQARPRRCRQLVAARAAPVPRAHRRALARPGHGRHRAARRAATVDSALRIGTPSSGAPSRSTTTSRPRSAPLEDLVKAPTTTGALRGLTATRSAHAQPQLRFLGPFVTVCNTWNQFWTFAAEHFSAPDDTAPRSARCSTWPRAARNRRHRLAGRQRVRPRQGRAAGRAPSSTSTTTSTVRPSTSTATPTAARARPATSRPQPAARQERQGRPLPGRRDRALPHQRAPGAHLRAVRPRGQGRRPEPRARAGRSRRSPTVPAATASTSQAGAMRRGQRKGMSPVAAGLLTLVVLCVVVYFGFTSRSRSSTTTRCRPSSARPTTSAPARRCAWPGSTWARSPAWATSRTASRRRS